MEVAVGYRRLFGNNGKTYEEWLKNIPTEAVILFIIILNNEINIPEQGNNKITLPQVLNASYTDEQRAALKHAFGLYGGQFQSHNRSFFARYYLMAMLLRELKRNNSEGSFDDSPDQKFRFLMSYLQIIDDVFETNEKLSEVFSATKDEFTLYRLLWCFTIEQYEFNQDANPAFEFVKLYSYCKYCYNNLRPYLKEYLDKLGFANLSEFIASFQLITNSTFNQHPDEFLKGLGLIDPNFAGNEKHLAALSINHLLGSEHLEIADVRKFPLYETSQKHFMAIDHDMCRKKVYRGPFFEIFYSTSLKQKKSFGDHCSHIGKGVMEEICFRAICTVLRKSEHDNFHYDDSNNQSQPDAYARYKRKVVMIEYKDSIFTDKLIAKADFDAIKKLIDEKFVLSDRRKAKGITQLANQIELLYKKQFQFDQSLNKMLEVGKTVTIYPILCYSDPMFSIPGANEYLNNIFQEKVAQKNLSHLRVKPVTMVSIETLFDHCMKGGNFFTFTKLIDQYWEVLGRRKQEFAKNHFINAFALQYSSFTNVYYSLYPPKILQKEADPSALMKLTNLVTPTQEQMDELL